MDLTFLSIFIVLIVLADFKACTKVCKSIIITFVLQGAIEKPFLNMSNLSENLEKPPMALKIAPSHLFSKIN